MERRSVLAMGALAAAGLVLPQRASAQEIVLMRELYNRDGSFSDYAMGHDGARVRIEGYMAPPIKAETNFFVLTRMPMAVCPFCDSEANWPRDIVSVYGREVTSATPFNVPIYVSGVLQLGTFRDDELGFVSRVRLTDAEFRRA